MEYKTLLPLQIVMNAKQLKRSLGSTCHVTRRKRESGEFLVSSGGEQKVYFWRLFQFLLVKKLR
jgi:hypothetical protein